MLVGHAGGVELDKEGLVVRFELWQMVHHRF